MVALRLRVAAYRETVAIPEHQFFHPERLPLLPGDIEHERHNFVTHFVAKSGDLIRPVANARHPLVTEFSKIVVSEFQRH